MHTGKFTDDNCLQFEKASRAIVAHDGNVRYDILHDLNAYDSMEVQSGMFMLSNDVHWSKADDPTSEHDSKLTSVKLLHLKKADALTNDTSPAVSLIEKDPMPVANRASMLSAPPVWIFSIALTICAGVNVSDTPALLLIALAIAVIVELCIISVASGIKNSPPQHSKG